MMTDRDTKPEDGTDARAEGDATPARRALMEAVTKDVKGPHAELVLAKARSLAATAVPMPTTNREKRDARAYKDIAIGQFDDAATAWLTTFDRRVTDARAAFKSAVAGLKTETEEAIKGKKAEDSPPPTDGE